MANEKLPSEIIVEIDRQVQCLYEATCEYVKNHQGEKGYIDTQDYSHDLIYVVHYYDFGESYHEYKVRAVRYNKEINHLQVVCENLSFRGKYQPEDFDLTEEDIRHAEWYDVASWGEFLYIDALYHIAEKIEQFVD